MEYRSLGRTGVKVSPLCLGTMMFGRTTGEAESIPIIEHALASGINFVDTADIYGVGESESIVGKVLATGGRRARVVLATKVFFPMDNADPNARGISRRHIIQACEDSLRRLQTDWIDLYQLHRSSADIPIDESLRALDDLVRQGKVRYIGASMFPAWKLVESLWAAKELGLNRFVCEQDAYNLLDRAAEREVLPAVRTFGLGFIPWGPLCGGLLSGKYRRGQLDVDGRWRGGKDNVNRTVTPEAFDVIDTLVRVAERRGCTPSQAALAWNAAQPGVTAPIIGPRIMEQLVDNLGAADVQLDAEGLAELDRAAPPMQSTIRYYEAAMQVDFAPNTQRW
jgi:aryl-alcohol dehydrogenase-like predicted oxidoreductase